MPSIIVDSGHGYHAYWLLAQPLSIGDARLVMEALRLAINPALDKVSDAPRMLRLPGTLNLKNDQRLPVQIIHWEPEKRFDAATFEELLDLDAVVEQEEHVAGGGTIDADEILAGVPEGQRNPRLFGYACSLESRGLSKAEALVLVGQAAKNADPPYPSEPGEESVEDMVDRVWRTYRTGVQETGGHLPDPEGAAHAVQLVVAEAKESQDVEVVFDSAPTFAALSAADFGKVKVTLKEALGDKLNLNDFARAVKEAGNKGAAGPPEGNLPIITVNGQQLRQESSEALQALYEANEPPVIFQRGGLLVRVRQDEQGRPIIEPLKDAHLRGHLTRAADFYQVSQSGLCAVAPPMPIVQDIRTWGEWDFPPLMGLTEVPVLRPDGSLLVTPGYDQPTGLLYVPAPDLTIPSIPESPSRADVQAALKMLNETISDFPFVDEGSHANTLGLLVTPVVRPMMAGPVPLSILDAPKQGTGKTLLADGVGMIATGRPGAMMQAPRKDEEWDKRITAELMRASPVILIDNVGGVLQAPSLSRALTGRLWSGRILGESKMVHVPQRATWIATGNNVQLGGDMPRRCYWIRLDAEMSKPWERTGFKHDPLLPWIQENRGGLLAALLTLARGWIVAGKPSAKGLPVFGSFEEWVEVVGGILVYAGEGAFLGNLDEFQDRQSSEDAEWEAFLTVLQKLFGGEPKTAADIARALGAQDGGEEPLIPPYALPGDLAEAWAKERGSFTRRLGWALRNHEGTRFGECQIHVVRAGGRSGATLWRVMSRPEEGGAEL